MDKLHFSVIINAPKEKVWDTMLNQDTYKEWTKAFSPGSNYEGNWNEGSKIVFLDGKGEGMVSRIKESRPYEYISIEHLGIVHEGKEDTESEAVKPWAGALENYTFRQKDGKTEILIETDTNQEYKEMFQEIWPKALNKLKEISEK